MIPRRFVYPKNKTTTGSLACPWSIDAIFAVKSIGIALLQQNSPWADGLKKPYQKEKPKKLKNAKKSMCSKYPALGLIPFLCPEG